jgi:hypothetical protein
MENKDMYKYTVEVWLYCFVNSCTTGHWRKMRILASRNVRNQEIAHTKGESLVNQYKAFDEVGKHAVMYIIT